MKLNIAGRKILCRVFRLIKFLIYVTQNLFSPLIHPFCISLSVLLGPLVLPVRTLGKGENEDAEEVEVDLMPRTDIADKFTQEFLDELADKNWKTRRDALDKIKGIFEMNKYITGNLGELPVALAKRLGDVNKVLVQTTIEIFVLMAASLGKKNAKGHVKVASVGLIGVIADSKVQVKYDPKFLYHKFSKVRPL